MKPVSGAKNIVGVKMTGFVTTTQATPSDCLDT